MYRGLHTHEPAREFALSRIASATLFRRPVQGPRELFYADIFASRATGCWSQLGLPGMRDQHAGCVGAYLVEHDLFDFLLLSLPDNDTHSHKHGPHAQVASIAAADRQIERVMDAAGGTDAFLDEHAVIVVADHSHAPWRRRSRSSTRSTTGTSPRRRAGRVGRSARRSRCARRSARRWSTSCSRRRARRRSAADRGGGAAIEGVDLVLWRDGEEGVIASARGELRFAPGRRRCATRAARRWTVGGDLDVAAWRRSSDGVIDMPTTTPTGCARVVGGADLPDVRRRAAERRARLRVPRLGRRAHVGGGSHGSLHRVDSVGVLLMAGVDPPPERADGDTWSLVDVAPMAVSHFLRR